MIRTSNERLLIFRDPQSGKSSDDSKQRSISPSLSVNGPKIRRSSVVVIPPMQVCPGDLLVYSKALTHGGNISGIIFVPIKTLFCNKVNLCICYFIIIESNSNHFQISEDRREL